MVSLVYLGNRLKEQLESNPEGLSGVQVIWQGPDFGRLNVAELADVSVLVVELEALGPGPVPQLDRLRSRFSPELTLVLHHFAKRDVLSSVLDGSTRTLQAPVPLASLRSQMLSLIVRDMLSSVPSPEGGAATSGQASESDHPRLAKVPVSPSIRVCPECGAALA